VSEVDAAQRVVVVEDTAELPLRHPHAVRLEARPSSADGPAPVDLAHLVRTALRLRPDRIVVGEVRGDEVLALVQAMNTGHDGSISTCHANSPIDALLRLESLVLQAAPTWPLAAIRHQLARSIDVVVHVDRHADGQRRVTQIAEVAAPSPGGMTDAAAVPTVRPIATIGSSGVLETTAPRERRRR
jgi:pilus assembly protein CpaF